MIDKINGNGVYGLQGKSSRQKKQAEQPYENTPGVKELNKDKNIKKGVDKAEARRAQRKGPGTGKGGVILDLSSDTVKKQTSAADRPDSITKILRNLFAPVFAPVVQWLKNFWESDFGMGRKDAPADENGQTDAGAPDTDPLLADTLPPLEPEPDLDLMNGLESGLKPESEPAKTGALYGSYKIPAEVLKSGNLKQMQQLLTRNGERRLAHNSDLLTYYDCRGMFVSIDESEKNRVLYGDKNVHRL